MAKKLICILLSFSFYYGCDSIYCGLNVKNQTHKDLYIIISAEPDLKIEDSYHQSITIKNIINQDTVWNDFELTPVNDSASVCAPTIKKWYKKHLKDQFYRDSIYVFIFNKEDFRHQSWDSIVTKKIYEDVLKYSIDSLEKMNWKVDYKGKYTIENPIDVKAQ